MAEPGLSLDRKRQLELEAEAEFELEQELAAVTGDPSQPTMQDFGNNLLAAGKGFGTGIWNIPQNLKNTGKALGGLGVDIATSPYTAALGPTFGGIAVLGEKASDLVSNQTPAQSASQLFSATVGNVPLAGPAASAGVQMLADIYDERSGNASPTTAAQKSEKFGEIFGGMVGPDMALGALRGVNSLLPEPIQGQNLAKLGRTDDYLIKEAAAREGITGNIQNIPSGTTAAKAEAVFEITPHENHLLESGVLKGLDTSKNNRVQVFDEYLKRLDDLKEQGKVAKETVVKAADDAVTQGAPKIGLANVDRRKLQKLINDDLTAEFTLDDANTATVVRQELVDTFQADTGLVSPEGQPLYRIKEFRPSEIQTMIRGIDKKLEQLGAYDRSFFAKLQSDDKMFANVRARLEALRVVRGSLDDALKTHVESHVGLDAVDALNKANKDIQTGIEYGNLGKRFRTQTGEAFTPGSGRSVTGVFSNMRSFGAHALSDVNETLGMYEGLAREAKAVKRLQTVAGARGVPGYEVPRMADVIIPSISRGVTEGVAPIYNSMVLYDLKAQGAITPEQAQAGVYGTDLDPAALQKSIAFAEQVVAPIEEAQKFGTPRDVHLALSNATRSFPEAFPPSKTGIPGEIEIDGKIALPDDRDKNVFLDMINQVVLGSVEKAKVLTELNKYDTISKLPKSMNKANRGR